MSKVKRRRRSSGRKGSTWGKSLLIPAVVALVAVALVVGIILSADGKETSAVNLLPNPDVPRINLDETQAMLEQGQAILVDVRSRESFEKSHAAGALSIPEDEMGARLTELPRDQEIILYCT